MESILTSVKKMLGIVEEYDHFDPDIIIHINSVFLVLNQIGVGPKEGFAIEDKSTTWDEYIGDNLLLNAVKSYLYLKVRLLFDPPLSSAVEKSSNELLKELEWRIRLAIEQQSE